MVGRHRTTMASVEITASEPLVKKASHLTTICDIHQKVATFSWYNPLCTGNMADTTSIGECNQGSHISTVVSTTIAPTRST
jgi:hypothetical protein